MSVQAEIERVVNVYRTQGIVTRNDVSSIDLRSFGRQLEEKMKNRGFSEARYTEVLLQSRRDYSGVLYNSEMYTDGEVEQYMINNVLSEN